MKNDSSHMGADSLIAVSPDTTKAKILFIRDQQVMLDKDIAALYEIKPIRLREQVQRNIERFPKDFMFRLSEEEVGFMVSQNAIPSRKHLGKKWFAFSRFKTGEVEMLERLRRNHE